MIKSKLSKIEKTLEPQMKKIKSSINKSISVKDWTNNELKEYMLACKNKIDFDIEIPKSIKVKESITDFYNGYELTDEEINIILKLPIEEILKQLN